MTLRREVAESADREVVAQLPQERQVLDLRDRAAADDADLEPGHDLSPW